MQFGQFAVDYEDRGYNPDRMRKERVAKAQASLKKHGLGAVYTSDTGFKVKTDPDTVRCPDVAFVARDRVVDTEKFIPLAPDLAIEVLSPGDTFSEVDERVEAWLGYGTREVWVVDPRRRTVQIFRPGRPAEALTEQDAIDGGDLLPGFRLVVRDLFPAGP